MHHLLCMCDEVGCRQTAAMAPNLTSSLIQTTPPTYILSRRSESRNRYGNNGCIFSQGLQSDGPPYIDVGHGAQHAECLITKLLHSRWIGPRLTSWSPLCNFI